MYFLWDFLLHSYVLVEDVSTVSQYLQIVMIDRTYVGIVINSPEAVIKIICRDSIDDRVVFTFPFPRFMDHACNCFSALQRPSVEIITTHVR